MQGIDTPHTGIPSMQVWSREDCYMLTHSDILRWEAVSEGTFSIRVVLGLDPGFSVRSCVGFGQMRLWRVVHLSSFPQTETLA